MRLRWLRRAEGYLRLEIKRAWSTHARRLVRFALVGSLGVVVNSAVLALLVEAAHLPPAVGAGISTETAILSNFALNDRWTFAGSPSPFERVGRAWRYNLAALAGLLVSVAVVALTTHALRVHYLLANLAGVGAGFLCNYTFSVRLAWAGPPRRGPAAIPEGEQREGRNGQRQPVGRSAGAEVEWPWI